MTSGAAPGGYPLPPPELLTSNPLSRKGNNLASQPGIKR